MKISKTSSLVLLAAIAALSGSVAHAQRALPVAENFSGWNGYAPLPSDFIFEGVVPSGTDTYFGIGDGSGSVLDSGVYNFGGSSFGLLEGDQGDGDLGDSRLFLHFQNTTGSAITRLRVKYKVQIWRDGPRLNAIRLKYNTSTSGFSSLPDLANTSAKVNAGGDVAYNGASPAYYTQVDTEFNLPSSLANNASAYLRWQYSTASGSGRRDGLAITDIEVSAVPTGTDKNWVGGAGAWNPTGGTSWSGAAWNNAGNYNAVFAGTAGAVTLGGDVTATDVKFNVTGYSIAGADDLTLVGRVDVASGATATINAPVAGSAGLLKTGAGVLQLGGANTFTGTLAIDNGTVKAVADNTVPAASVVQLSDTGVFDLNGHDLTVNGLQGDALGEVKVPSGSVLTLNTTSNYAYKGAITGAGDVVKTGASRQRFRNTTKTYTGATTVGGGVLEITENGVPTATSGVTVNGGAELLLTTDVPFASFAFGGAITLNNGHLASDTDLKVTLPADIVVVGATGNAIYARSEDGELYHSGSISGSGTFGKQGDGILWLLADSTAFTGTANLNDGVTYVADTVTFGDNATVNVTDTGALSGDGVVDANVNFQDGSILSILGGEQLDIVGTVTLSGTVTVESDGAASGTVLLNTGGISGTYTLVGGHVDGTTIKAD